MASSSSWKPFFVLFLVGIFSSSSITVPTEASRLFFSKYVHASTKTNPQVPTPTPISQISQPPASSPTLSTVPAPAPTPVDSQNDDVGYGLWGTGSGRMVVPTNKQTTITTTTTTEATDPTYKDDEELEAALGGGGTSSTSSFSDEEDDNNKQKYNYKPDGYSSSSSSNNYDDNVDSATTTSYSDEDNKQYKPNSYSSSISKYENSGYPATTASSNDDSNQYKLGATQYATERSQNNNNNFNNGNSFATNYNTDASYYIGSSDETENVPADDSNSRTNEYKLGNAQYLTRSQNNNNNNDQGNSFAANYGGNGYYGGSLGMYNSNEKNNYDNSNGYEAEERQGMSDTRFVEGGKYYYNLNNEDSGKTMSYDNNWKEFGSSMGDTEEQQQVNWP